jgi:hypothetical protein
MQTELISPTVAKLPKPNWCKSKKGYEFDSTVRNRNLLMFEIFYVTGLRSREVLALRINDIDFLEAKLSVVRRQYDPCSRQALAKTLARTISIPESLAIRLRVYVMTVRAKISGANEHPFIFVTHKMGKHSGQPISDTFFRNRILAPVIETNPELFEGINRHGFRYNRNDSLSKDIDTRNQFVCTNPEQAKRENKSIISEINEIQIRKQINGWSSDETAETFNIRFNKEQADMLMRIDMVDQSKHLKKGK